jgi:Na+-driven multidrug efflux pump
MGNLSDVTGFYSQLFNFLAEVTGPLVASQIAAAKAEESENRYDDRYENIQSTTRVQAAETVRGAMTVAVVLGVSACLALEFGAENVLRWSGGDGLASSTGVDGSGMMHQAEMYLRVRALSAPAALIGTVSVGAYRGLLDTKTPLHVSGAANAVNLGEFIISSVRAIGMMTSCFIHLVLFAVLDPILIFGFGPVPAFGVAGAAAATTAAEWIAAVVFWKMLVDEGLLPRMGQETKSEAEPTKSSEETFGKTVFETGLTDDESGSAASSPDGITGWFSAMKPLAAGSASQLVRTLILQAVLLRATAEAAGSGAAGSHQICIQVRLFYLLISYILAIGLTSCFAYRFGGSRCSRWTRWRWRRRAWWRLRWELGTCHARVVRRIDV